MMTEEEFMDRARPYGMDAFTANIGAEAIREMLAADRPGAEADSLRADLKVATGELKPKKIIKRLKVVEASLNPATARMDGSDRRSCDPARACARWFRWMVAVSRHRI